MALSLETTHLPSTGPCPTLAAVCPLQYSMSFAHLDPLAYQESLTSWHQCEHLQLLDRKSTLYFVWPCPKVDLIPSALTCLQRV